MPDGSPDPPRHPTMRDVAAAAGVSLKTVSRVVNGEPAVSPDLSERVLVAVQRLGYRHNLTASSLRRADGKSRTIGLLFEDVANPFFSGLHHAVEDVARAHRTLVLAASTGDDLERERDLLHAFASRRVDGIIAVPATGDHGALLHESRLGTPVTFVDRLGRSGSGDSVIVDNALGARLAVRHLVEHGHRRVAYLGDRRWVWTAEQRYHGYAEALSSLGIPADGRLVRHDLDNARDAEQAALELLGLNPPPTALFTAQNLVTIGAVRALQRLGQQHDVALVGFDDVVLAELLDPGITVIAQDVAEIGTWAADLLFARIADPSGPHQHLVSLPRLVERGSGELPGPHAVIRPARSRAASGRGRSAVR